MNSSGNPCFSRLAFAIIFPEGSKGSKPFVVTASRSLLLAAQVRSVCLHADMRPSKTDLPQSRRPDSWQAAHLFACIVRRNLSILILALRRTLTMVPDDFFGDSLAPNCASFIHNIEDSPS